MPATSKGRRTTGFILAVIDGLTPAMLERGLEEGRLPALAFLRANGSYARATTAFPSVTPVCMTSLATGAHPDVHHVPHMTWFHRGEGRLVDYGSSFSAMRAVGARRSVRDAVFEMAASHVSPAATTVFEALEDAGRVTAAVNVTCYRGRTRHAIRLPALAARNRWYEAAYGPTRFFFYNMFESDVTGAPIAIRSRLDGSIDAYAAQVGRWLVTRDAFDFLLLYLPDYDYASHVAGPDSALAALERADDALAALIEAAGGGDELLERYAVVVCSDHGQTPVEQVVELRDSAVALRVFSGRRDGDPERADVAIARSNRAAMVYRLPRCPLAPRALAERVEEAAGVEVVLFREDREAVARRGGRELRFAPTLDGFRLDGDRDVLDPLLYPRGIERAWRALACPNAGDVVLSAADGWEFADLGGRHHVPGGSHGSLGARDSLVPVVAAGVDVSLPDEPDITDLAPLALAHLGVETPASMGRGRAKAA